MKRAGEEKRERQESIVCNLACQKNYGTICYQESININVNISLFVVTRSSCLLVCPVHVIPCLFSRFLSLHSVRLPPTFSGFLPFWLCVFASIYLSMYLSVYLSFYLHIILVYVCFVFQSIVFLTIIPMFSFPFYLSFITMFLNIVLLLCYYFTNHFRRIFTSG